MPLSSLPLTASPSIAAALALLFSSFAGLLTDKFVPSAGILVTLIAAALLSNLGLAPISHPYYDLCWTLFLPASLALLLLSSDNNTIDPQQQDAVQNIRIVAIPFVMASLGSIAGCVVSFLICRQWPLLWLSLEDAVTAAACLCASYIGGSVNFFATAKLVSTKRKSFLLSSMAAADLLVMAVYFAVLTAALQSKRLQSLFKSETTTTVANENDVVSKEEEDNTTMSFGELNQSNMNDNKNHLLRSSIIVQRTFSTVLVATIAWIIVQIANRVEEKLSPILPGTACAVISVLATLVSRLFPEIKQSQHAASVLSQVCFHLLFSSIGMSANLGYALRSGPACVWFSLTALVVHMVITLGGSLFWRNTFATPLKLEHVLVASNAAIGGPATAAAFCGQHGKMRNMTLAATVWGVVGYAIGTGIGVLVFNSLRALLV